MTGSNKSSVAEKVKAHATDVAEDAKAKVSAKAKKEAEAARDAAAGEAQKAANAAEAAAAEFDPDSIQAQAMEHVAQRIDDLARHVRSTDIDRLARSVSDAARRNPLLFVAGAALAGFAATRFLKARSPHNGRFSHADDPWGYEPRGYASHQPHAGGLDYSSRDRV